VRAYVTGGTSGIGRACVERLRADGADVVFSGRNDARGRAVAQSTGAAFLRCDLTDRAAADRALDEAIETLGGLDALVLNAGILFQGSIEETPDAAFRELLEVNVTAVFRAARRAWPVLVEHRGAVVVIGSDTTIRGVHGLAAYSVSKAAVGAVSELLAGEGAPVGVRVNCVCPGDVEPGVQATPRGHEDHAEDPAGWVLPPGGRFGTGEDVAGLVAWLVGPESTHVNGATIRIDGGMGAVFRAETRAEVT
jgi:NAD(P)-dependent dehydrogenase (short-subunit alcohol dehydrogenase family)